MSGDLPAMHGEVWGHELDGARLQRVVQRHLERLRGPATMRITLYPEGLTMTSPADARGCRILVSSKSMQFPFVPQSNFTVRTFEYQRELAEVKSTALFSQIRLRREAQLAGFDDVLFRRGDEVLEGATWTVLCWRDGQVTTPRDHVLASITAWRLGRLAEELGWRFRTRPLSLAELLDADLTLASNANTPARAIRLVDSNVVPVDDDLLATIANAFSALPRDLIV